jgi:putative transposase
MPRPPRLEYANAVYHVTSRGIRKSFIFRDDEDHASLLAIAASAFSACDAHAFAYCLMGNHYHFVLQTRQPNLSVLMHRINSTYSAAFNRRHGLCGAVFEARFKAAHVDRDNYLLEACRYVDLNPVRAGLIGSPAEWTWSSHAAHTGRKPPPCWLASAELHGMLMGQQPEDAAQTAAAQRCYTDWVQAGRGIKLWNQSLGGGRFLGDQAFVERVMRLAR